jgi:hypothetical protein
MPFSSRTAKDVPVSEESGIVATRIPDLYFVFDVLEDTQG